MANEFKKYDLVFLTPGIYPERIDNPINTAVEWLVEQLTSIGQLEIPQGSNAVTSIINEAKEIEKGQKRYSEDDLQECMLQMAEYLMDCLENNTRPNSEQKAKEIIDLFKKQEQ